MSYCRFGWDGSQVYIIGTTDPSGHALECVGCRLHIEDNPAWQEYYDRTGVAPNLLDPASPSMFRYRDGTQHRFTGPEQYQQMLTHVAEHRAAGHHVPDYVDEHLHTEMKEHDDASTSTTEHQGP